MSEQEDCLTERPRFKRLIDEHEAMKGTLNRLEPSITSLIESMDKLAEKVGHVHDNHTQLRGAIIASAAAVGLVATLIAYIYLADQKATERHLTSILNEHRTMQEAQAKSAAERELLFKALLTVIDGRPNAGTSSPVPDQGSARDAARAGRAGQARER